MKPETRIPLFFTLQFLLLIPLVTMLVFVLLGGEPALALGGFLISLSSFMAVFRYLKQVPCPWRARPLGETKFLASTFVLGLCGLVLTFWGLFLLWS